MHIIKRLFVYWCYIILLLSKTLFYSHLFLLQIIIYLFLLLIEKIKKKILHIYILLFRSCSFMQYHSSSLGTLSSAFSRSKTTQCNSTYHSLYFSICLLSRLLTEAVSSSPSPLSFLLAISIPQRSLPLPVQDVFILIIDLINGL